MEEKVVKPVSSATSDDAGVSVVEEALPSASVSEQTEPPVTEIPIDSYLTSPLFHEVANYFDIDPRDYDGAKDKLESITDYIIRTTGSDKFEDIVTQIRSLENRIQPPAWGEKRYNNLYKYVRLASQRDAFSKAMTAYEREVKENA